MVDGKRGISKLLGVPRTTLQYRMKKTGDSPREFHLTTSPSTTSDRRQDVDKIPILQPLAEHGLLLVYAEGPHFSQG